MPGQKPVADSGGERPSSGSSYSARVPILRQLSGFRRPMQIIWLGRLHNIGRFGQRRPQIEVVLRSAEDPTAPNVRRLVPAAFVRALRLGDVWHGSSLTAVSSSPVVRLANLRISTDPSKVQPIGKPLAESQGEYPLDFRSYWDHAGHTGAFAVRQLIEPGRWLIVPCWELLRFYFSASGSLASRLLSGPLAGRSLYRSIRHDARRDVHWLDLAPGMHSTAAATIARIALDARAASAARWIINSGTAAFVNGEPFYPKTDFPFEGLTDLTVQGRWFESGTQKVLLAERVVSCTHPFPFRTLHYSVESVRSTPLKRKFLSRTNSSIDQRTVPEITEAALDPTGSLAAIHLPQDAGPAFPDLVAKRFRRVLPRGAPHHGSSPASSNTAVVLADGSDSSVEGFPQVELASHEEERGDETVRPQAQDLVAGAIALLNAEGLPLRLRSVLSVDDAAVPIFVPLGDVVSNAGELGRAFDCIAIRRRGGGASIAYCLVRTDDQQVQASTHLLILVPKQGTSSYQALREALDVLTNGSLGRSRVVSAPEFAATSAFAVARLIRRALLENAGR